MNPAAEGFLPGVLETMAGPDFDFTAKEPNDFTPERAVEELRSFISAVFNGDWISDERIAEANAAVDAIGFAL